MDPEEFDAVRAAQNEAILRRVRDLYDKWSGGGPVPRAMAHHLGVALAVHKGDPQL